MGKPGQLFKSMVAGLAITTMLAFTPIKMNGEETNNRFLNKELSSKKLDVNYMIAPIAGTSLCIVKINGRESEQKEMGEFLSLISKGEKNVFPSGEIKVLGAGNSQRYAIVPFGMSGIIFFEGIYGTYNGDILQKVEYILRGLGSVEQIGDSTFVSKTVGGGEITLMVAGKSFFEMPQEGKCNATGIESIFSDVKLLYKVDIVDYAKQVEILDRIEKYEGNNVYFIKIKDLNGNYAQGKLMDSAGNFILEEDGSYKTEDLVYGICVEKNLVGLWASK